MIGVVYFASWDYWASSHFPSLPHVGTCAGNPYAAIAGCVILSSYLVLFIMFYLATYKRSAAKKGARKSGVKPSQLQVANKAATAMANDGIDRKVPVMAEN